MYILMLMLYGVVPKRYLNKTIYLSIYLQTIVPYGHDGNTVGGSHFAEIRGTYTRGERYFQQIQERTVNNGRNTGSSKHGNNG